MTVKRNIQVSTRVCHIIDHAAPRIGVQFLLPRESDALSTSARTMGSENEFALVRRDAS